MFDLLITNAVLLDLDNGSKTLSAVGVNCGRIAYVSSMVAMRKEEEEGASFESRKTIDAGGKYLFPGFVDFHTHLFRHGSQFGMDADLLAESGITSAADMGSAGWVNYPAMYQCDLLGKKIRLTTYLNISPVGQPGRGVSEPLNPEAINLDGIQHLLEEYPGTISGLKVRLSKHIVGDLGVEPLQRTVEAGERFGLPVCVHTTNPPETPDKVAALLRPGDIYSHTYQGRGYHCAESSEVLNGMLRAKERGVLIEVGNGSLNFCFPVAEKCLKEGLTPDIISSDATPMTFHNNPAMWDLARVASKFLSMGMPLTDVIRAVTKTPAQVLGIDHVTGTIAPGLDADLALFEISEEPFTFRDCDGNERNGSRGLVPLMTIRAGQIIWKNE